MALREVVAIPVAEHLTPRTPLLVGRRGPVPAGGIGTSDIKSADGCMIIEQNVQLRLRRYPPVPVAVRIEPGGVFLRLVEFHGQGRIRGSGVHRLAGVGRNAGVNSSIGHEGTDGMRR